MELSMEEKPLLLLSLVVEGAAGGGGCTLMAVALGLASTLPLAAAPDTASTAALCWACSSAVTLSVGLWPLRSRAECGDGVYRSMAGAVMWTKCTLQLWVMGLGEQPLMRRTQEWVCACVGAGGGGRLPLPTAWCSERQVRESG